MKNSQKIILLAVGCLLLGVAIGYAGGFYYEKRELTKKLNIIRPIRENNPSHKFIDPLLAYIIPSSEQETRFVALKDKINSLIATKKKEGLSDASIFLSDLNRGRWMGIKENVAYPPASMFKVVIMTAYLKGAEEMPGLLNEKLVYTKEVDNDVKSAAFNSTTNLKIGSTYIVKDLIDNMIIDSDNGAEVLLLGHMDKDFFEHFYSTLKIDGAKEDGSFMVSPRAYSLFFRILYSATYLDKASSETALSLLSKTTFNDGIVAGVPKNILVAHKFGEYVDTNGGVVNSFQLHDCGIVYYPEYPYLLCVMTKGSNLDQLENTIKEISSMVYQNYQN